MSAQAALADGIARAGVHHVFGVPVAGPTTELAAALDQRGVRFIATPTEATAAMMAGAVGRLSGRPGVALAGGNQAFANLARGLSVCLLESFPVVALVDAPRDSGANHEAIARASAKGRVPLGSGKDFAGIAALAAAEAPGPVVSEFAAGQGVGFVSVVAAAADPQAAAAVVASRRPAVIAGTLAGRRGWAARLAALKVPVFSTVAAKGVVDETLPHAAGVFTGAGLARSPEAALLAECDLVVGLGLRPGELLAARPFACAAVNVDVLASSPALGFQATTADSDSVFAALTTKTWEVPRIQLTVGKLRLQMQSGPFQPAQVFDALDRHFRHHVRAVFDAGPVATVGEHAWRARRPDWCLASGQARQPGIGIPMALGAAFHDATVPTVCFIGDAGIAPCLADLRLAARNRLPVLFVLLSAPGPADEPSWLKVVSSLGLPVGRAHNVEQFTDTLAAWQWHEGPAYVEVPFEPETFDRMVEGLR